MQEDNNSDRSQYFEDSDYEMCATRHPSAILSRSHDMSNNTSLGCCGSVSRKRFVFYFIAIIAIFALIGATLANTAASENFSFIYKLEYKDVYQRKQIEILQDKYDSLIAILDEKGIITKIDFVNYDAEEYDDDDDNDKDEDAPEITIETTKTQPIIQKEDEE